jgi:hypothetical protein
MYLERKSEKTMDEQQRNQSLAAHVISSIGCGHYEMPGPPNFALQSNQSTEFRILNSLRKRGNTYVQSLFKHWDFFSTVRLFKVFLTIGSVLSVRGNLNTR